MTHEFARVLVPLDGSVLAEAALPYARLLVRAPDATVTLLHVIERGAPDSVHGDRHLASVGEAEAYLTAVAERLRVDGVRAETHVHPNETGDTAGGIVDHAAEYRADLVVLCNHGRGGLQRFLFGSIAQKVLGEGVAPVLLVIPTADSDITVARLDNIVLALDGTPEAEVALPLAEGVVRTTGGSLTLLLVVPTAETLTGDMAAISRFTPTATAELLQQAEIGAGPYLQSVRDRLAAAGVVTNARVKRGEPATTIADTATRIGADLIVMASHGRAGFSGALGGSVGNRVVARSRGPFLLVRAPGEPTRRG